MEELKEIKLDGFDFDKCDEEIKKLTVSKVKKKETFVEELVKNLKMEELKEIKLDRFDLDKCDEEIKKLMVSKVKKKETFVKKLAKNLKFVGVGCLKAILFLGIVITQPVRWALKLTIWPFIKLGRNIYCRINYENEDENTGEENAKPEEGSKKTGKSLGQKICGVMKELGMFVGGYVFSALRRIFISDVCGLYNIARNEAFFGDKMCRMNSFCDGVDFKYGIEAYCPSDTLVGGAESKNYGKFYFRVDGHQNGNWGCSDSEQFHLADYLRYISGYSDVLNKNSRRQNSIIRKMECCCLSEDSPEMYC